MVRTSYIPASGDIVWLEFLPQAGREQGGRRPALVLSPKSYNQTTGRAIVCPITSRVKGYPFEVPISGGTISGAVLSDHLKSLDWHQRKASLIERANKSILADVVAKIQTLLPPTD